MQLITGEFLVLSMLLFTFTRLKTHLLKSEQLLRGLRLFMPPTDEDLKTYAREPHKFAISYLPIDDKFSVKSHFFAESDFLLLMSIVTALLSVCSGVLRLFLDFEQTLSFYMCLLVISLCVTGLYQQFLHSKLLSPDNGIGLIFSLLLFSLSAVCMLTEAKDVLDFDFTVSLRLLGLQLTYAMQHAWDATFTYDYTVFALVLSGFFALMLLPSFGFILRATLTFFSGGLDVSETKRTSLFLMVAPVLCVPLWIKPMCKDLLVPSVLSELQFCHTRTALVLVIVFLRLYSMRTQIQHFLNQAVGITYSMFAEKDEKDKKHSKVQVTAINSMAWARLHQLLCVALLAGFLALLCFKRGSVPTATLLSEPQQVLQEELDEEEFSVPPTMARMRTVEVVKTPVLTYAEVVQLEDLIRELKTNRQEVEDTEGMVAKVVVMNRVGFVPPLFYRDLFNYCLFWYHVHWALSTAFAILYSRRFGAIKIKQV